MISSYEQLTLDYEADPGDYQEPSPTAVIDVIELTPEQTAAIDERVDQGFNYFQAARMAGVELPDAE
jgi:hypothetical protein